MTPNPPRRLIGPIILKPEMLTPAALARVLAIRYGTPVSEGLHPTTLASYCVGLTSEDAAMIRQVVDAVRRGDEEAIISLRCIVKFDYYTRAARIAAVKALGELGLVERELKHMENVAGSREDQEAIYIAVQEAWDRCYSKRVEKMTEAAGKGDSEAINYFRSIVGRVSRLDYSTETKIAAIRVLEELGKLDELKMIFREICYGENHLIKFAIRRAIERLTEREIERVRPTLDWDAPYGNGVSYAREVLADEFPPSRLQLEMVGVIEKAGRIFDLDLRLQHPNSMGDNVLEEMRRTVARMIPKHEPEELFRIVSTRTDAESGYLYSEYTRRIVIDRLVSLNEPEIDARLRSLESEDAQYIRTKLAERGK